MEAVKTNKTTSKTAKGLLKMDSKKFFFSCYKCIILYMYTRISFHPYKRENDINLIKNEKTYKTWKKI